MRVEQVEIDDVKGPDDGTLGGGDVAQQDVAVLANRAHPAQAGDRVGVGAHAGDTHTAEHLSDGQDEDLLGGHGHLRAGRVGNPPYKWTISRLGRWAAQYSATRRRWQCSGVGSAQSRQGRW